MSIAFKRGVFQAFQAVLELRVADSERELSALAEAASQETKSSAGDKYETSREMFAQARDLHSRVLSDARTHLEWLSRQDLSAPRTVVGTGALVETSNGWVLVAPIPLAVEVDGIAVQGVSPQSPLGQALKGAKAGDRVAFRTSPIEIVSIA